LPDSVLILGKFQGFVFQEANFLADSGADFEQFGVSFRANFVLILGTYF
jgi:hypothetical protein